jgi:excisionase family DNA binding protein
MSDESIEFTKRFDRLEGRVKKVQKSLGALLAQQGGGTASGIESQSREGANGRTMLTPKQAADRIGVSDSLVYQWCEQGVLAHYRFGGEGKRGRILIEATDFDAFLVSCRQEIKPVQNGPPPLKHIKLT